MDVRVRTTLPASVTTPAAARALVRDAGHRSGATAVRIEDLALVVSELVTNAVLHGAGDITLEVVVADDTAHVAVTDSDPEPFTRADAATDAESGRGLLLVSRIATRWGVSPRARGKVVWADLAS